MALCNDNFWGVACRTYPRLILVPDLSSTERLEVQPKERLKSSSSATWGIAQSRHHGTNPPSGNLTITARPSLQRSHTQSSRNCRILLVQREPIFSLRAGSAIVKSNREGDTGHQGWPTRSCDMVRNNAQDRTVQRIALPLHQCRPPPQRQEANAAERKLRHVSSQYAYGFTAVNYNEVTRA